MSLFQENNNVNIKRTSIDKNKIPSLREEGFKILLFLG